MRKFIIALLIFSFATAEAQYQKPFFNTLTVQSGLPEANVQNTLEDRNGYLWMGTQNGLVRYDGYNLKAYPMLDSDGIPITGNSITHFKQGRKGEIWALTFENGLYYYEPKKDKFLVVPFDNNLIKNMGTGISVSWFEDKDDVQWLILETDVGSKRKLFKFNMASYSMQEYSTGAKDNFQIAAEPINIIRDNAGNIWLLLESSIYKFDAATQSFKTFFAIPESLKTNKFARVVKDPADSAILWLLLHSNSSVYNFQATAFGRDILRFNTQSKTFQQFTADSNNPKTFPSNCFNILRDSLNRIWLTTEKGVSLYDSKNNNFTNYPIKFPNANANSYIYAIASDKLGNVWLGGLFQGLCYLNTTTGITTFYANSTEEGSLPFFNYIDRLFFDRSGTLWVNMPWFGMAFLNKQSSLFASQSIGPDKKSPHLSISSRFKIVGSQGDSICFIADTSSLYSWHTLTNQFEKIDIKQKEAYRSISSISVANDRTLWIGSHTSGLFHYNPATKAVIHYKNNPGDSASLVSDFINLITVSKSGIVWIGTGDNGLCSFNPQTKKFKNYPFIKNDNTQKPINKLDDQAVQSMLEDENGILWIGTNYGSLNRFDPTTNQFTSYLNRKQGLFCVVGLLEDSKKRLWVATYQSGLFLFDRATGNFKIYNEDNGLLHNTVLNVMEDAMGNIWCVSERGLSRLDPQSGKIDFFARSVKGLEGLLSAIIFKDAKSIFHLSLNNGMMRFDPAALEPNQVQPVVIIESISYHDADAVTAVDTVVHLAVDQTIKLKYNENKIGFQFVALHFADAANNKYAYQLVGYDDDWVQAGTQRTATYTNLSSGTYTFKVKASNGDGIWNETGTSVTFTILPPWWKTWWAYLIYALIVIGSIWTYIAYRSAALKRQNKVLEDKVTLRTTQLQTSISELKATQSQLIQSEKMASLGELTAGIAHEIQNPLNFVNNFSELNTELLSELKEEAEKGNLNDIKALTDTVIENSEKINHHGKRAEAIVKGMLQHSRSSNGQKEPTDINALCDEYFRLAYHGLRAKDKSFNAKIETRFDNIGKINVIPQDLGRVVLNLITNAFYAVDEKKRSGLPGYEPTVTVSTKKINDKVEITVTDNGNGIPENIREKIFQPFFTTKPTGKGTGLGLSMSYDIVTNTHGGEINLDTKQNEGTTFTITLPA